jgi:hypothetical protein
MDDGAFKTSLRRLSAANESVAEASREIDGLLTASEAGRTARRQSQDKEFGEAMMRLERLAERHEKQLGESKT